MRHRLGAGVSLGVLTLLLACNTPPEIGVRYRAERDLVRTNRDARRLMMQPSLADETGWRAIAARFEAIAAKYERPSVPDDGSPKARATRDVRQIVARSLVNAAEIYGIVSDSTKMVQQFEHVASGFEDLPAITAEVALARGRIAQARGQWANAIAAFQIVVDTIEPAPGEPGVAGSVVDLPITITRLQARTGSSDYETARRRYEGWITAHPGTLLELDARARLVDLDAERGDLSTAIKALRVLEAKIVASGTTARDPAAARFATAAFQSRVVPNGDSTQVTLLGLLRDYPKSSWAPRALLELANLAAQRGKVEDALGYLGRIRTDHADSPELVAQALFARGTLLERNGRWPEALETFKSLPLEQPTSEAALQAPLEIVLHYAREHDEKALTDALTAAEQHYRDFIARFPPGRHTLMAQTKLVRTLALQKRFDDAIVELVDMGESATSSPAGATFLIDAARMAFADLKDSTRAVELLERTSKLYPNTDLGRWASVEAARLRETR